MNLLLLPGLACDEALWRPQLAALQAAGRAARVVDVHTRCESIAAMAEALLAEHAGALVLVGTSMGGMVALETVRRAPDRVRGIALLATTARPDTPDMLALRAAAIERFARGEIDAVLHENVPYAFHPAHADDARLVSAYVDIVRRAGAAQLIAQNRAVMARADLRPALASIGCPALVLAGDADGLTPLDCAEELAAAMPHARLEVIRTCGHLMTLEQPAAVSAALLRWLDEVLG